MWFCVLCISKMNCFSSLFFLVFYIMLKNVSSMEIGQKNTNDAIGFPEIEENPLMVNKQNRQPVFIPSICPENQLLYPGDQSDDWICDCRAGHIYHPKTDKCWLAYHRGPCDINEYLVLNISSAIPICKLNPCKKDATVVWNGKCKTFGTPCGESFPVATLWVNPVTLNVDCGQPVHVPTRFGSDLDQRSCPVGSRRNIQYNCKA